MFTSYARLMRGEEPSLFMILNHNPALAEQLVLTYGLLIAVFPNAR